MSTMRRLMHLESRDQKRENARDRSNRYTQIADDLLRDGMEEAVFARLDSDAPAKLPMDCEAVDFIVTDTRTESDRAIDDLRERLTRSDDFDPPYPTDAEIEEAWAEMREEEANASDYYEEADDHDWPESDAIWPPACSIQDVWDAMGYETGMRGYSIITPRP